MLLDYLPDDLDYSKSPKAIEPKTSKVQLLLGPFYLICGIIIGLYLFNDHHKLVTAVTILHLILTFCSSMLFTLGALNLLIDRADYKRIISFKLLPLIGIYTKGYKETLVQDL